MKFCIKSWSKNSRARVGLLQLTSFRQPENKKKEIEIETPALVLTTRKGLPAFVSPDHLVALQFCGSTLLQFSPMHFMEGPNPKTISNIGGIHQLLGLKDYGFVSVPRDSILSLPESSSSNKHGASFETPCGRFLVKPVEYMKMISSMKPDLWVSLADEVPASATLKRNRASVERTIRWLDDCISLDTSVRRMGLKAMMICTVVTMYSPVTRKFHNYLSGLSQKLQHFLIEVLIPILLFLPCDGALFGSIVGGCSIEEREHCAQEVAKRNVAGYYIGGFGLGDSIDGRASLLHAVTDCLPNEKPRQICGLGLPEEVLQGVAAGIDLFDSTYIYQLTLGGFALTFPLDGKFNHVSDPKLTAMGGDRTKINLKATVYRKDASRIVDGCNCYTCQNHTKAYINHLLNVHEMLAPILLEM
ncbi:queuine tRNA-ribosyltransferase accessory subunit 2-like protein [Tanacetum coccineum]|uniref:Queuine tRNA-ribosyltransferase accessory subunit 2-like protein n=1 Tax=Tanacetum coccineum TaxID=301880 RepID=A0ABQ5D1B7_9ASTR